MSIESDLHNLSEKKGSIEQSIHNAEGEFRELIKEVRVYNDSIHSWMEKEFETVKTLPDELERVSSHVTNKKKRKRKKLLAQKGSKVASKEAEHGSSNNPMSELSSKRKNKHKISTSQAQHSSLPGTHLTPLSPTTTLGGIDAILAAGKSASPPPTKKSNTTGRIPRQHSVKSPNGVGQKSLGQTNGELTSSLPRPLKFPPPKPLHKNLSEVTSPTFVNKGKLDNVGKAGASSSNKTSKHDIQLFTILDTTVSPPLPRYIAKMVPEATALIPLSGAGKAPLTVGSALTALASTHKSISSAHSTLSSTHTASSSAHSTFVMSTPIPRVSSSLAQNKSHSVAASSNRDVHKDTASRLTNHITKSVHSAAAKKIIKPVAPPTVHVCDQPGCKQSFSQLQLLTLHTLTVHNMLPELIMKKKHTAQNGGAQSARLQKVAAAHALFVDRLKMLEQPKVTKKRVRSPSCSNEDPCQKFMKLESDKSSTKPTSPVHSTAPKTRRNFARKSTGGVHLSKRKRVSMKSMQLKLRKISICGLKLPKRKVSQAVIREPYQNYGPKAMSSGLQGYRNPEFFRNLIRSQLKMSPSYQKATTTSDYISLHSDTESISTKQGGGNSLDSSCTDNEDSSLCARAIPFIGNCARTRKFTPEVFGQLKRLSEQDRVMSSSSSISSITGEEMRLASSEDESFPLVKLSPMVSRQEQNTGSSLKTPNVAMSNLRAVSPLPQPMDDMAGLEDTIPNRDTVQSPLECEKIQKETCISMEPPAGMFPTRPKSPIKSPALTLPGPGIDSNEYTMRLLQTIAKLSGDMSVDGEKSRRSSVLSPPPPVFDDEESSDLDDEPCTSLVMSIDLSRLSRVPVTPPLPPCPSQTEVGVFTHRLGSFTSRGAQVERGLIIDCDDLEHRLTVKVNEALCEMKEKLEKTERRVREVMKEKDQLEKMLEAKLKMIMDLTTTGIKPVFADKETMTDPVKEATVNKKQTSPKLKSIGIQTKLRAERQTSGPSKCLSHLSDNELEEYLRVTPPATAPPSDNEDDAPVDVVPASSKNRWMFESSDSARSSAFNLQVRFMRALTQSVNVEGESTPSSVVSSSLLSREHCSTFTKIQRINQQLQALQLQVLPLASVLKERVNGVSSSVSHLLSHLPLAKGGKELFIVKLSIGSAAFNVGWKIKELLTLLTGINTDRLPGYFKAELKLVTKQVQKALEFGVSGIRNVTVDHTIRPPEEPRTRQLRVAEDTSESDDFDLEDILSSSDDNEQQQSVEEELEVASDRDSAARGSKRRRKSGDTRSDKGQKKHRKRKEKKTQSKKGGRQRHSSSPSSAHIVRGKRGRFEKAKKPGRSRASKTSKDVQSAATNTASVTSVSPAIVRNSTAGVLVNRYIGPVSPTTPLILRRPTAVVNTPSSGGGAVTVTPINRPILPFSKGLNPSNKDISEPLKLLTSLAASLMSRRTVAGRPVVTCAASNSQPQPTQSTNTAVSLTANTPRQVNSIGTNTSSSGMSGRVEVSNLASSEFTPIVKALSPTSTSPSGPSLTNSTPLPKDHPVSTVSTAPQASPVQVTILPPQMLPQPVVLHRPNPTASSNLSLSSSTLPPAVIAASSLLSLPQWSCLPSIPPSVVTASIIPALQGSARQVRAHNLTTPPAPLMRASTLLAPFSAPPRLATPSVAQPPSLNMAPDFTTSVLPVNVTPLFATSVVAPPSCSVTVAPSHSVAMATLSTTPTVTPPPTVTAASFQAKAASSSAVPTIAPPPTTISAPSSLSSRPMAPSSTSRLSKNSASLSKASTLPMTSSTGASSPSTVTVTPVEVTDLLPDLPESSHTTTVVVIDPLPEAEPTLTPSTTVVKAASTSSGSLSMSSPAPSSTATTLTSKSINSESNPIMVTTLSSLSLSQSNLINTAPSVSSCSSSKASTSLVASLLSSTPVPALLTSSATPRQVNTHCAAPCPVPTCGVDTPLPSLQPQKFLNLLKDHSTSHPLGVADREQSTSQGVQISTTHKHTRRRSPRVQHRVQQNQASVSPSVAALKASIYKKRRRNSPQRKAATRSVTTDSAHPLVTPSPSPLADPYNMNPTTLSASSTLEDAKMMYSQSLVDSKSRVSMTTSSLAGTRGQSLSSASPSSLPKTVKTAASRSANGTPATPMSSSLTRPTSTEQTIVSTTASAGSAATPIVLGDDNECTVPLKEATPTATMSSTSAQTNATTSNVSQKSSNSTTPSSAPPKSSSCATKKDSTATPPPQELLSPISSPTPNNTCTTKIDFVFPDGITPHDVTPLVQVIHDTKGVLIKWTLPKKYLDLQAGVTTYELYAHIVKGGPKEIPPISEWSKVGVVKPLKLPMAVTLTNVMKTKKYMFSVRALFGETRASQFSKPSSLREDSTKFSCHGFIGL